LNLLQKRDYATSELVSKLRNYGFDAKDCSIVVDDLVQKGLVNDTRFAEVFARTKARAGWGLGRIEYELGRRGVDTSAIADWPHAYIDPELEFERAVSVAERKHVRPPNEYAKLVRFLMGRGFAQCIAMNAARTVLNQNEPS
jgi:regulatory protein